jgi:hypothetical protein
MWQKLTYSKVKEYIRKDLRLFVRLRVTNNGYNMGEVVGVSEDNEIEIECWGEYHTWPHTNLLDFSIEPSGSY